MSAVRLPEEYQSRATWIWPRLQAEYIRFGTSVAALAVTLVFIVTVVNLYPLLPHIGLRIFGTLAIVCLIAILGAWYISARVSARIVGPAVKLVNTLRKIEAGEPLEAKDVIPRAKDFQIYHLLFAEFRKHLMERNKIEIRNLKEVLDTSVLPEE